MPIDSARLLAQKGLMLAHAAGTDEFEGFKYVLKADGHWRRPKYIRVEGPAWP
jgi:hypothetical protein